MPPPAPNGVFKIKRFVSARDGDSVVLSTPYPGLPPVEIPYRLRGIDCPERHRPGGPEATAFTTDALRRASRIVVQAFGMSFDRVVGDVWVDDALLQDLLLAAGHALVYTTPPAPRLPRELLVLSRGGH